MASNAEKIKKLQEDLSNLEGRVAELSGSVSHAREALESAVKYVSENLPIVQQAEADIRKYKETSQSTSQDTQAILVQLKESVAQVNNAVDEILGEEDDNGDREGGLLGEAQEKLKDSEEKRAADESERGELKKKIEDLLPAAATAGLASAFNTQRATYYRGTVFWPFVFMLAIGTIVLIGFNSFADITAATTIDDALIKVLARLPYYLAAVWLAAFASKRQSQNKRLEQEYAHKETVARSLEGYKREIAALDDESVLADLMKAVVGMLAYNPSTTLDGNHGDDRSPIHSALDTMRATFSRKKPEE